MYVAKGRYMDMNEYDDAGVDGSWYPDDEVKQQRPGHNATRGSRESLRNRSDSPYPYRKGDNNNNNNKNSIDRGPEAYPAPHDSAAFKDNDHPYESQALPSGSVRNRNIYRPQRHSLDDGAYIKNGDAPQYQQRHSLDDDPYSKKGDPPQYQQFLDPTPEDEYSDDNYFDDDEDEMERQPLGHPGNHKGKLLTFYRNGDKHFKGLTTSVSRKQFISFETLLIWLNEKIPTTAGVRHVFALQGGKEIKDLNDFTEGSSYVVSSSRVKNKKITYGESKEIFWTNKAPSAGRIRRHEHDLFIPRKGHTSHSYPGSRADSFKPLAGYLPIAVKPRVLNIVSNTNRNSKQKVILNPQTTQTFEDMLKDVGGMLDIQFKPVEALYTARAPFKRVQSFSHLLKQLKSTNEFLACGREIFPMELQQNSGALNGEMVDDTRYSPLDEHNQLPAPNPRQSDPPDWAQKHPRPVIPGIKKDKPYRKSLPELESVKVHIHGQLREFFVPRYGQTDNDGTRPDTNIELNWVYGYRGIDGKNNLYTLPSGELVYYVATVAIVYNKQVDRQRHYQEHNEDITCMAIYHNGSRPLIATGQLAGKSINNCAHIRIWDPYTLVTQCVVGTNVFQTAVAAISFSGDTGEFMEGSLLLAIDDSNKHTLSVWDWRKGRIIAKTSTTADSVIWGTFHPLDHSIIITYGKQHIYFWKMFWSPSNGVPGRILRDKKSGLISVDDHPRFVTSVCFSSSGDVIMGDSNGAITVWIQDRTDAYVVDNRCSEAMKHAHKKSIFALCMNKDGTLMSGAGDELKAWDSTNHYRLVKERLMPEGSGNIRVLMQQNPGSTDGSMYLGTTNNSILEGSLQDKFITIVQGHSEELWAIAAHPDEQVFVTAGYDQSVCKWDMQHHKLLWKTSIEKPGLSVGCDPFGRLVVVGTTMGRFIVLEAYSGMHMASVQVTSEALDGIKFSPDGTLLAMGSHDGNVYIYEVLDEGQTFRKYRGARLKGHNSFVNHLDWSKDGRYLQTVSGDYDLLFWDISTMKAVPAQMMREIEWASQSCVINYNILGAWSNLKDGDDITTVCRNHQADEIAVGDNHGNIKLYRFPCTAERPEYYTHKKYSGKMNKLAYSYNDRFLVSSGGTDAGLMQWAVIEEGDYL